MNFTHLRGWKALVAIFVAGGALLWHLLACVESPMAFSPSGKELAFVTMEPYEQADVGLPGPTAYRLMVLSDAKDLRVLEETVDCLLTAPAFSPDGKRICYLRVPLPTASQWQRIQEVAESRQQRWQELENIGPYTTTLPAEESGRRPTVPEDLALPSLESCAELFKLLATRPLVRASLVVRDAKTGQEVSALPAVFPLKGDDHEKPDVLMSCYLTCRPQYSPDGKAVYFSAGDLLCAVDLESGKQTVLAAPAGPAVLSPDGKTIAAFTSHAIAFIAADGQTATYVRWDKEASLSGLAWRDNRTLAVLESFGRAQSPFTAPATTATAPGETALVHLVRTDGTILKPITLSLPPDVSNQAGTTGQLAVALDGKGMVLSFVKEVFFLDANGKVLKHWRGQEEMLVQPTFTPDSNQVAFKSLSEDEKVGYTRTSAIVFFTPEGKELKRVPVPPIKPGTTHPATAPATMPAASQSARAILPRLPARPSAEPAIGGPASETPSRTWIWEGGQWRQR
jgi:hypothetical protein